MDGTKIGIFKEGHEVSFGGFLKSEYGGGLETKIGFKILSDFSNQPLERQFSDEKFV